MNRPTAGILMLLGLLTALALFRVAILQREIDILQLQISDLQESTKSNSKLAMSLADSLKQTQDSTVEFVREQTKLNGLLVGERKPR